MDLSRFGQLIGDPVRARMLARLLGGTSHTAGELARDGEVTPQTASSHLSQLVAGGLLSVTQQGRFRYFRLANAEVAQALEALSSLVLPPFSPRTPLPLRFARTCYDHLAGRLGVALAQGLSARGWLQPGDASYSLTAQGRSGLEGLGVPLPAAASAKACLDWSERRPHLGGALGAAVTQALFAQGWLVRVAGSRGVRLTVAGRIGFERTLGVDCRDGESRAQAGGLSWP